jgi:hypothetical protein
MIEQKFQALSRRRSRVETETEIETIGLLEANNSQRNTKSILHFERERNSTSTSSLTSTSSMRSLARAILFLCVVWSKYVLVEPFFLSETSVALRMTNNALVTTKSNSITSTRSMKSFRRSSPIQQQSSPSQSSPSQSSSSSTSPSLPSQLSTHQSSPAAAAAQLDFTRSFRSILARNRNHHHRQRFVTGQFPVIATVEENPTRKWLDLGRMQPQGGRVGTTNEQFSTSVVLVNGTNIDRSLASYDRYQWLDDPERQELHERYATVSMELLAEISLDKPGYLQIMQSTGAGSSAAHSRNINQQLNDGSKKPLWNRWRNAEKDSATIQRQSSNNNDVEQEKEKPLRDRLWSTGFSLTSPRGFIKSVDIHDGHIDTVNPRSESMISWPNEITQVPTNMIKRQHQQKPGQKQHSTRESLNEMGVDNDGSFSSYVNSLTQDALLVADGFLVPGKDRGGIYVVNNPANKESEWSIPLTDPFSTDRWFYHKSIWVDLTGDGRQSILTARAKLRKVATTTPIKTYDSPSIYTDAMQETEVEQNRPKNGQLIWLEMPKPHHFDVESGTPLEEDGTPFNPFNKRHLPWKERVLATGPDVTFAVADMDPSDDTIEILASQFFDEKVTLHSIKRGANPEVTFSRVIDDKPGAAFGGILVDLDPLSSSAEEMNGKSSTVHRPRVVNSGSTIKSLSEGSSFSHFLVTSHEFDSNNSINSNDVGNNVMITEYQGGSNGKQNSLSKVRGGSLLAYKVPRESIHAWKTEPWIRTTVASGFQVKQQIWNVINPGAPGFAYAFHAHKDDEAQGKRPMIAVAGDCAESAYIFRPQQLQEIEGTVAESESGGKGTNKKGANIVDSDPQAEYKLMCEIKCGATVGSIAVGYDDLCSTEQESGYAKIYIPCFEKDKILVFALGSGEEEDIVDFDDSGW